MKCVAEPPCSQPKLHQKQHYYLMGNLPCLSSLNSGYVDILEVRKHLICLVNMFRYKHLSENFNLILKGASLPPKFLIEHSLFHLPLSLSC